MLNLQSAALAIASAAPASPQATGPLCIAYDDFEPIYGLKRTRNSIEWLMRNRGFPRPFRVGRRTFWVKAETDAWFAAQIASRDGATDAT